MRAWLVFPTAILPTACGGPVVVFPGGALEGFDEDRLVHRLDPREPGS